MFGDNSSPQFKHILTSQEVLLGVQNSFHSSGASSASDSDDEGYVLDVQGSNASQDSHSDVEQYCRDVEEEDNEADELISVSNAPLDFSFS